MIYILSEDVGKIAKEVETAIASLGNGAKRIDLGVDVGDQLNSIEVTGYWVHDIMRIDIKVAS